MVEEQPIVQSERRTRYRAKRNAHRRDLNETLSVDGRCGPSTFHGKAARVIKEFDPSTLGLPVIPFDIEVEVWGRSWICRLPPLERGMGMEYLLVMTL
jgi:hypothetical protein